MNHYVSPRTFCTLWCQLILDLDTPKRHIFPMPVPLDVLPEAEPSPSEPRRTSKLISKRFSARSSSGTVLMASGSSSSHGLEATFLALRVLPFIPGALLRACRGSVFQLGSFRVRLWLWPRPRPRPREEAPRFLGSSASSALVGTESSKSLSSLKFT